MKKIAFIIFWTLLLSVSQVSAECPEGFYKVDTIGYECAGFGKYGELEVCTDGNGIVTGTFTSKKSPCSNEEIQRLKATFKNSDIAFLEVLEDGKPIERMLCDYKESETSQGILGRPECFMKLFWMCGGTCMGRYYGDFLQIGRKVTNSFSPPPPTVLPQPSPDSTPPASLKDENPCPLYMNYIGDIEYWKVCKWKGSNRFFCKGDMDHYDLNILVVSKTRLDVTVEGKTSIILFEDGYWQKAGPWRERPTKELDNLFNFCVEYSRLPHHRSG